MTAESKTIKLSANQHAELMRFAFGQIHDPDDWRGPIDCVVPWSAANLYMDAIRFMTATEPEFDHVGRHGEVAMARLKSIGYRAGPAGA